MKRLAVVAALAAFFAGGAHAASITTDFETGADGWSGVGFTTTVETDGGPGGAGDAFLAATDSSSTFGGIRNQTTFAGNLLAFDGGSFSFDYREIFFGGGSQAQQFGRVTVSSGGASVNADFVSGFAGSSWMTASGDFSAATFSTSQTNWENILSNVTSIRITVESRSNSPTEIVGIDNIALMAAVPLPAGGLLLIGALGGLAAMRRRRGH